MSQTDIIQPAIDGKDSQHQSPSRLEQTPSHDQLLSSPIPGNTPTAREARQNRKITQLEQKLETLEAGCIVKERQTNHYIAKGRAIRRVVALFDNVEDLISENDRRYEEDGSTQESVNVLGLNHSQDRLQLGYVALNIMFPWFQKKAEGMDYDEYCHMLKMLRQGADMARGDDTAKLKSLVAEWVNMDSTPDPHIDADDKHYRGFINDACGKLLCPAELDWNDPIIKAGIHNRSDGYLVTDLSFPAFLYERYSANAQNLEEGLFKGKILVQAYKAVFTSPSSAKDVEADGDGADISANNRRAQKSCTGIKVKKHVRFALSSVTSWCSVDGDFDYVQFWRTIVDFFEKPPGRTARRRVEILLEWWTRYVDRIVLKLN
ncbi:hypothetical protein EV702DRAFT_979254 [Suillus placidus]|uniref:Uncharacterized protein n=1 Tax=Suillus placidus TaxID=48579 RepID=A0A9P7CWM2_9AGAM|nr:hypothetical protein EV702DRAFT_979254 [Suillus placidus]